MNVAFQCPRCRGSLSAAFRCPGCGAAFRHARIGTTDVADFLDVTAPGRCRCPEHLGETACAINLAEVKPAAPVPPPVHYKTKILKPFAAWRDKVVVDVGCREGPLGRKLTPHNFVLGVDCCPKALLTASPNALDAGYRFLLIADGAALPLSDATADLVVATDVLEHVLLPEKLIHEAHRVLKPGGLLLTTVPNLVSYNNRLSILLGYGAGVEVHQLLQGRSPFIPINGPRYPDQRKHLRWFTVASLRRVLTDCGFQVERTFGYDPLLSRLPGLDRLLRGWCLLAGALSRKI